MLHRCVKRRENSEQIVGKVSAVPGGQSVPGPVLPPLSRAGMDLVPGATGSRESAGPGVSDSTGRAVPGCPVEALRLSGWNGGCGEPDVVVLEEGSPDLEQQRAAP